MSIVFDNEATDSPPTATTSGKAAEAVKEFDNLEPPPPGSEPGDIVELITARIPSLERLDGNKSAGEGISGSPGNEFQLRRLLEIANADNARLRAFCTRFGIDPNTGIAVTNPASAGATAKLTGKDRATAQANGHVPQGLSPEPLPASGAPLQALRDEVRAMVGAGKPLNGIPLYRKLSMDGDPIEFLKTHYGRYLPGHGNDTLFAHDLGVIDARLRRALYNMKTGDERLPIQPKSAFIDALIQKKFSDGPSAKGRIQAVLHMRRRENYQTNKVNI